MAVALTQTLRSRSFAVGVHAALWLLLLLILIKIGGKAPDFREEENSSMHPESLAPIARMGALFESTESPGPLPGTESPFFTRYFVPAASPTPPPPTTRKIEVTYQGYYQTTDGPRNTIIKVGDSYTVIPVGAAV